MAANLSQRKLHSAVMGAEIGFYRDWYVLLRCRACRDTRQVLFGSFCVFGRHHKVVSVVNRLRCHACGNPPDYVRLQTRMEGHPRHADCRHILLVGPGAYG